MGARVKNIKGGRRKVARIMDDQTIYKSKIKSLFSFFSTISFGFFR